MTEAAAIDAVLQRVQRAVVDAARLEVKSPPNLTSAIRQWLFGRALVG